MMRQKDQHKVGIPEKPRGQETGFGRVSDQNRQEMQNTPAISGRRKRASKMFGDKSSQQAGSDAVTPSTNSPSTPAMNSATRKGESGGEQVFKRRLAKKRKAT
jgi:hypothetical protein